MFHILSCTLFVASLRFYVEERNVICYKIYINSNWRSRQVRCTKIMRNTFEECFIEYTFSILLYSGNKVWGLNLIQIQFFKNNWRPSSGWIWNTLPSYFAHMWWTRAQCLVSLTKLQWDRLDWGSLVPPPSWHVYYWLCCSDDFTGWQCISKDL